jgi:transcription elongation factor Elf1
MGKRELAPIDISKFIGKDCELKDSVMPFKCPYCGIDQDVQTVENKFKGRIYEQTCVCSKCGKKWINCYELFVQERNEF